MHVRRHLAWLATAVFAAPVAVAAPAHAEVTPAIQSVTVGHVTDVHTSAALATMTVRISDPSGIMTRDNTSWDADAEGEEYGYTFWSGSNWSRIVDTADVDVWRATSVSMDEDPSGRYAARVSATIFADTVHEVAPKQAAFLLRAHTRLSADAAPEPVLRGKPITVQGKLTGFNRDNYRPAYTTAQSGVPIRIYFRPGTTGAYSYMGTAYTNSYGVYKRAFTASRTGQWYARYMGNTYYVPVLSAVDTAEVR